MPDELVAGDRYACLVEAVEDCTPDGGQLLSFGAIRGRTRTAWHWTGRIVRACSLGCCRDQACTYLLFFGIQLGDVLDVLELVDDAENVCGTRTVLWSACVDDHGADPLTGD